MHAVERCTVGDGCLRLWGVERKDGPVAAEGAGVMVFGDHPTRLDHVEDLPRATRCRDQNRADPHKGCSAGHRKPKGVAIRGEPDAHVVSREP